MNFLIFGFLALTIVIQFWAFIDIAFTKRMKNKDLWFLAIICFPVVGSIFYFQNRKKVVRIFNPTFNR
ncbi:MAG: PLDc N-terminal domain-containing protein [Cyclobacteriaceae bacterium]|nr:PLDc N-terminal domain-containing protein [Cyclobacteriaceae bacterium]